LDVLLKEVVENTEAMSNVIQEVETALSTWKVASTAVLVKDDAAVDLPKVLGERLSIVRLAIPDVLESKCSSVLQRWASSPLDSISASLEALHNGQAPPYDAVTKAFSESYDLWGEEVSATWRVYRQQSDELRALMRAATYFQSAVDKISRTITEFRDPATFLEKVDGKHRYQVATLIIGLCTMTQALGKQATEPKGGHALTGIKWWTDRASHLREGWTPPAIQRFCES
jgi:hypothetical protein